MTYVDLLIKTLSYFLHIWFVHMFEISTQCKHMGHSWRVSWKTKVVSMCSVSVIFLYCIVRPCTCKCNKVTCFKEVSSLKSYLLL